MSSHHISSIFRRDRKAQVLPLEGHSAVSKSVWASASLLVDPAYPHQEGRGVYLPVPDYDGRFYYIKGAGNSNSLQSTEGGREWRKYTGIGHRDLTRYFFDPLPDVLQNLDGSPRVRGALALEYAVKEYIVARVLHDSICKKMGIVSKEEARRRGLSIPVSVVESPGISSEIMTAVAELRKNYPGIATKRINPKLKYGLVVLEVPSAERLRRRDHVGQPKRDFYKEVLSSPEKIQLVGRTLLRQLGSGFVSLSTHYQNIYQAADSLCPQADNSDLVPISEILRMSQNKKFVERFLGGRVFESSILLRSLVMKQLEYAPFNLLRAPDEEIQALAIRGIHGILDALCPGQWNAMKTFELCLAFRDRPYSSLKQIAETLISAGLVETSPQAEWRKIVKENKEYNFGSLLCYHISKAIEMAYSLEVDLARLELK